MAKSPISANFQFLSVHDVQLERLGALAERYFADDPNTCLIKLRQFGELLAQLTAANAGEFKSGEEQQAELLRRLKFERIVPQEITNLFHHVRIFGNRATHEHGGNHAEALATLKIARELGVWFHRTFGNSDFRPGPFVPPRDPGAATEALREKLERLRQEVIASRSESEQIRIAAEVIAQERLSLKERAEKEHEERVLWERLAQEAEQARLSLAAELAALQAAAERAPTQTTALIIEQAQRAASDLHLDEATTRTLIDEQLRARGWEADTKTLRFSAGVRPSRAGTWQLRNGQHEAGRPTMLYSLDCIASASLKPSVRTRTHRAYGQKIETIAKLEGAGPRDGFAGYLPLPVRATGSRPTEITRRRPCRLRRRDGRNARPEPAERPAIHFTIYPQAIEIGYPHSEIF
jgi:hypothetical protein